MDWIKAAGGLATAFDVTTKGILHAVFEVRRHLAGSVPNSAAAGAARRNSHSEAASMGSAVHALLAV